MICHEESHLGLLRLNDDVATAADDCISAVFLYRNQGHVGDEVDVKEVGYLVFRQAALWGEEAAIARLALLQSQRCQQTCSIGWPKRAYFNGPTVTQVLDFRESRSLHPRPSWNLAFKPAAPSAAASPAVEPLSIIALIAPVALR